MVNKRRTGLSNEQLLVKLDRWVTTLSRAPTIFEVVETRDSDLFAAYVLRAFRAATRRAVLCKFEHYSATNLDTPAARRHGAALHLFEGFAREWSLEVHEQLALLGLGDAGELDQLKTLSDDQVPIEVIERTSYLLDIYIATNALLPEPARAASWIRAPNEAPLFAGRAALQLMKENLDQLRAVCRYLQGQMIGP